MARNLYLGLSTIQGNVSLKKGFDMTVTIAILSEREVFFDHDDELFSQFWRLNPDVSFGGKSIFKNDSTVWFYSDSFESAGYAAGDLALLCEKYSLNLRYCTIVDINCGEEALSIFLRYFDFICLKAGAIIYGYGESYGPESSKMLIAKGCI
jgi:hypothetical protein